MRNMEFGPLKQRNNTTWNQRQIFQLYVVQRAQWLVGTNLVRNISLKLFNCNAEDVKLK